MAGIKFTTDFNAETLYKTAFRRAQDMGYTVRAENDSAFSATTGNLPLSVIGGVYCDFRISVEKYDDGNELVLERNSAWWTGAIGVTRVKGRAKELMQSIKLDVVGSGGKVLREKEF